MADIAVTNVTHTVNRLDFIPGQGYRNRVTVAFGNGVLTYGSGGIPLDAGKMGLPAGVIHDVIITEGNAADGFVYKYDKSAQKIRMFRSATFTPAGTVAAPVFTGSALASHTHDIRVIGGQAAAGTDTLQAAVGDLILGKEEATNALIAGADQATKGGVVGVTAGTPAGTNSAPAFTGTAVSAAALSEMSGAVTATTLELLVEGY